MSFSDSIFLFVLALLLFGPKKLPVLARELGKWVGEFRRASNDFKMQMEEELRLSEQAERQKQIAAMEAAAPIAPALSPPDEFAHPHLPASTDSATESLAEFQHEAQPDPSAPLPIATSGDLSIMPPATGLPIPQTKSSQTGNSNGSNPLGALLDSIPTTTPDHNLETPETAAHGD